jgi:hypothetical protein
MAKHHVVPQFYLKNFSIAGSRAGVYTYARNGRVEQRNTRTIAYITNFYDFTDKDGNVNKDLEPTFSTVESDAKPILDKIITAESTQLSDEEQAKLSYFIATLYTRGKAYRHKTSNVRNAGIKAMMILEAQDKESFHATAKKLFGVRTTEEQIERVRLGALKGAFKGSEYHPDDLLRQSLISAHDIYLYVREKRYYLLKAPSKHFFITSDNPVTVHHSSKTSMEISGGGGIANSTMALPLSPTYCLMMDYRDVTNDCKEGSAHLVEQLNYLQAVYADEMLFSHTQSDGIKDLFMKTTAGSGQAIMTIHAGRTSVTG